MDLNYYTPGMSKEIVPILETALNDISALLECSRQTSTLKMIAFMAALAAGEAVVNNLNEGEVKQIRQLLIDNASVSFDKNFELFTKKYN